MVIIILNLLNITSIEYLLLPKYTSVSQADGSPPPPIYRQKISA